MGYTGRTFTLLDAGGRCAGAQLWDEASALAAQLGPLPRQSVLIETARGRDFVVALLASWQTGAAAVPIEAGLPAAERQRVLEDTRPAATIRSAGPEAKSGPIVEVMEGGPGLPLDAALLLFTSGTTARPKAALITHANLDAQTAALAAAWGLQAGERVLHALPLHHLHGLVVALLAPLRAGAVVQMLDRFEPTAVWDALGAVDVWMAVPTMYQRLLAAYDAADVATQQTWRAHAQQLRLATSGSAALPARLAEGWRALAGAIPLERYGMTEIGIALSNPLAPEARQLGVVGRPLPTVEIRLVTGGDDRPPDTHELWVRGPSVFAGYLDRPEATAEAFADGWFRTGDLVATTTDGALRIVGRISTDILKSAGHKLSALEIEEVMREHPAVLEVAVVGLPDEALGDRVVAAVVAAAEAPPPEALAAWLATRLSRPKQPRQIVYLAALPRNAMGKVQKAALVAMVEKMVGKQ